MKIFSIALNSHDHNTYDGVFHKQIERYSRIKHNLDQTDIFYKNYFTNTSLTAFSLTQYALTYISKHSIDNEFLKFKPTKLWDYFYKDNLYYIDHHQSHAAYAFLSSGYHESDILAIDGNGANFKCIFIDKSENIIDLSEELQIGLIWNHISKISGFGHLGAGKLMGLSAYGKFNDSYYMVLEDFKRVKAIDIEKYDMKDLACTLQQFTIDKVMEHVLPLKSCDNLCVTGGVAYNGYMNEEFTKHYKNVFVPPACGDEGQALGNYMHADYILNNNIHIPKTYAGEEHEYVGEKKLSIRHIAQELANGKIVGWFQGKSESGNRALGNRSILADPRNPNIKSIINSTIKKREDFRPFAPAVMEHHYQTYFDTNQPSPYMSRIVPVKRNNIPGVTHVDGTARIQTVNKEQNEKFFNLIREFYQCTGVPMLLNTSFNCQEPIVETPEQAINTFNKTELDILVINDYMLCKMG